MGMEAVRFIFTIAADGLVLIAVGALFRWVMPERFTIRTLLVVTAAAAFAVGTLAVALH